MIEKIKKYIFLTFLLTVFVLIVLFISSDFNQIIQSFSNFPVSTLLLVVIISILSITLKFFRWHYYLKFLKFPISFKDSVLYFSSGLIMSISPGKWGELIKSYLITQKYNIAVSRTAPIIFAERITEFIVLLLVAFIGVIIYERSMFVIYISGLALIFLFIILKNKKIIQFIFSVLVRLPILNKYKNSISDLWKNSSSLFTFKPFISMTLLSAIAWIFEFFCFYIILRNFIHDVSILWVSFTYAFSIILGAISMLPGGIGTTEGSLTYMLVQKGLSSNEAVTATIIMRLVTLWFSVIIGAIALIFVFKNTEFNLSSIEQMEEENAKIRENKNS